MDLGLKGKVAMVAGASRGLGFAVAQAELAVADGRNRDPEFESLHLLSTAQAAAGRLASSGPDRG